MPSAGLNPIQRLAVDHRGGPLLVLAGAGTGKTRVITHRVAALVEEGVPAWRILAVTFTNKAAGEMRQRISDLTGQAGLREMWVGTFHAIAARILRRNAEHVERTSNFAIYDTSDQRTAMGRALKTIGASDRGLGPAAVLGYIDRAKNRGLKPAELSELGLEEPVLSLVRDAWIAYAGLLRRADAVDFGDLMVMSLDLMRHGAAHEGVAKLARRFSHVVVDEFQDTNPVQAELVDRLSGHAELCVVGDDDQSIYGWRGADVRQILEFPVSHPGCTVLRLEQNYRSTTNILACADAVIRANLDRLGKELWSDLGEGEKVAIASFVDDRQEARFVAAGVASALDEGIPLSDVAVFYRTHAQSRVLEESMRLAGLSYRLIGGIRFFDRAEIKDLTAWLRLLVNPESDLDFLRAVRKPPRGIGDQTLDRLAKWAVDRGISLLAASRKIAESDLGPAPRRKLQAFAELIDGLAVALVDRSLSDTATEVIEQSSQRAHLVAEAEANDARDRLENLQEFVGAMTEFVVERPDATLAEFLESVALLGDDTPGPTDDAVTLMTVHSAKGLEYGWVFLTGLEERIFPHARSFDDPNGMEEERRLAYVAITRAKRRLFLTWSARRMLLGQEHVSGPSRFLGQLPRARTEIVGAEQEVRRSRRVPARVVPVHEPRWDADIELDGGDDLPFDDESSTYIGQRVRHAEFGIGEVVGWSGSGPLLKLQLRFGGRGMKTILARFCTPV